MKLTVIISLSLAVSGCAFSNAKLAKDAQTKLVGLSKAKVLTCAGAPARSASADGVEYLTYVRPADEDRGMCAATFVIEQGAVVALTYAGDITRGATRGAQCAELVRGCMPEN